MVATIVVLHEFPLLIDVSPGISDGALYASILSFSSACHFCAELVQTISLEIQKLVRVSYFVAVYMRTEDILNTFSLGKNLCMTSIVYELELSQEYLHPIVCLEIPPLTEILVI